MAKSEQQWDLSKIVISLSKGRFYGESRKGIIIPYIVLVVISASVAILGVTMMSIEYSKETDSIAELIGAIVAIVLGVAVLLCAAYIPVYKNEKIRKEVLLWVEDSIELDAFCRSIDVKHWLGIPLIKLQVDFNIEGIHYVRSSENERQSKLDLGRPVGFFAGVKKYTDKKNKILYSPKYDEVMILKD